MNQDPLHIVHDICDVIRLQPPRKEFVQVVLDLLESRAGYEFSAVLVVRHGSRRLQPIALSRQGQQGAIQTLDAKHVESLHLTTAIGLTGRVATTGRSVRVGDVRDEAAYFGMRHGVRSELCVPIQIGGHVLGVLNVESPRLNAYDEADQRLLEIVAVQLATVIRESYRVPLSDVGEDLEIEDVLPICAHCSSVRLPSGAWVTPEVFIAGLTDEPLSHGICSRCLDTRYRGTGGDDDT